MAQKRLRPPASADVSEPVGEAARIGQALRQLRGRRGLRQKELAQLCGMKSGQICSLELGRRQPSLRTLRRVCAALGTTPDDLLRIAMRGESPPQNMTDGAGETEALLPGLRELFETPEDKLFAPLSRRGILRTTRQDSYAAPLPSEDTVSEIERRITDYLRVEAICGAFRKAAIPLSFPFQPDADGAEALADSVRRFLGLGDSIVLDYVSVLENRGIRILFLPLPGGNESLSFYEREHESAFLIINDALTPEKQLFRLAIELAYLFLFTRNNGKPVHESAETNRRFAKYFAACFLLPRAAVLFAAASLGAGRNDWTFPLVLRVKRHFGVSAEAFCYRLLELGQISDATANGILGAIHGYYETHQKREPGETLPALLANGRLADLVERARGIPGAFDEARTIARHAGIPFEEPAAPAPRLPFFGYPGPDAP